MLAEKLRTKIQKTMMHGQTAVCVMWAAAAQLKIFWRISFTRRT